MIVLSENQAVRRLVGEVCDCVVRHFDASGLAFNNAKREESQTWP
jgi:hypothetical protein